ncbi:nuclear factor interleukin-3-regulated protein [Amia ocellicauda]|uniref:nuclear factor interleukin-3-regulated protein n=1 Tax=Amia ocellicauda TaxID=2972642 RepID=UPI00346467F4
MDGDLNATATRMGFGVNTEMAHTVIHSDSQKDPDSAALSDVTSPPAPAPGSARSPYSVFARSFLGLKSHPSNRESPGARRKREFIPEEQKDSSYWVKRRRNNEAARRSRQRRRVEEFLLESRAVELLRENEKLKAALSAVRYSFRDRGDPVEIPEASFEPPSLSKHFVHHAATEPAHHQVLGVQPPALAPLRTNVVVSQALFQDGFQRCAGLVHSSVSNQDIVHAHGVNLQSTFPTDVHCTSPALSQRAPALHGGFLLQQPRHPSVRDSMLAASARGFEPVDCPAGYNCYEDQNKACIANKRRDDTLDAYATADQKPQDEDKTHEMKESLSPTEGYACKSSEDCTKISASPMNELKWIKNLQFLPHKLRLKIISTQCCKSRSSIKQNTEAVKEMAQDRASLAPGTGVKVWRGTVANCDLQEDDLNNSAVQGSKPKGQQTQALNCSLGNSEDNIPAREQNRDLNLGGNNVANDPNTHPLTPPLFRELSDKRLQSTFHATDMQERAENGHLRNQLASLSAEVKHLKQMLLAKSTA